MSDDYFEFECPRCGSSYFGSDGVNYFGCHDEYNKGCGWQGTKNECRKYPNMEAAALVKMQEILENFGLQITLKTLADSLAELIRKRGPSIEACLIMEAIKGLHAGYIRRHEEDDFKSTF